ncbi:MAG: IS256 family transposase [Tannerella sp.]|jgi:transposase-like protein|nr:IS256 family transposase [Tannerella sp.]
MDFTQGQRYGILEEIVQKEDGINTLLQFAMESMMKQERGLYREDHPDDYSNGFRHRKTYGHGKLLELRVPRTRSGAFYPLLPAVLRNREIETQSVACSLYSAGLTCEQAGDVFGQIYGRQYSTSQVSRMFDGAKQEVEEWLSRPVNNYYPIIYIDACLISSRRVDAVSKEAFFTVLGVKPDRTREVLGVINNPTEGSGFWNDIFKDLQNRGLQRVDLFVSDGLTGIEDVIRRHFGMAEVQLCAVHLMRESLRYAKPCHKAEMGEDLREVFQTDNQNDSRKHGVNRWKSFCNKWKKYYFTFGKKAENPRYELYFTCLDYHWSIRSMIYSTNWIERLNRDYKRTTKMRSALPSPDAVLFLLGSVAMNRKAYGYKVPKLDNERVKFDWDDC